MSFKSRFDPSAPVEPPTCVYGPPWCGKCKPSQCIYMMEAAFIPEKQLNEYEPVLAS